MGFSTTSYPDSIIKVNELTIEPICTLKDPMNGERFHIAVENNCFTFYRGMHNAYKSTNSIPNEVWETLKSLNSPNSYKKEKTYEDTHKVDQNITNQEVNNITRVQSEEQFKQSLEKLAAEVSGVKSPFSVESRYSLSNKDPFSEKWISNSDKRINDPMSEEDPNLRRELANTRRAITRER